MKRIIKRFKSFNSKGSSLIIVLLIALIVAGGIVLTNGLFTDTNKAPLDLTVYKPLPTNFNDNRIVLQLKTINFESCKDSAVIGFLVDQSGSMGFGTKESNLKTAINYFTNKYPPNGVIGLKTYSSPTYASYYVPFDYFKNNQNQFKNAVSTMQPKGGTWSKLAFEEEKVLLNAARIKFPQYTKFNLIFISDGVPETLDTNQICPGGSGPASRYCTVNPLDNSQCRCFDVNQDPTSVATEIKNSGVRIFTIGYVHDEDAKFQIDLTELMKRVASSPDDFYPAPENNQIEGILSSITEKICKAQP